MGLLLIVLLLTWLPLAFQIILTFGLVVVMLLMSCLGGCGRVCPKRCVGSAEAPRPLVRGPGPHENLPAVNEPFVADAPWPQEGRKGIRVDGRLAHHPRPARSEWYPATSPCSAPRLVANVVPVECHLDSWEWFREAEVIMVVILSGEGPSQAQDSLFLDVIPLLTGMET